MVGSNQHVVLSNGRWCVWTDGVERATRTYGTMLEAVSAARESARTHGSMLFIHGRNGKVRAHNEFRAR